MSIVSLNPPSNNHGTVANDNSDAPQRLPLLYAGMLGLGFLATLAWAGSLGWAALRLVGIL